MVLEATAVGLRTKPFERDLDPSEQINFKESLTGFWWNLMEFIPFRRLEPTRNGREQHLTRM
jgi:hypothetical protein